MIRNILVTVMLGATCNLAGAQHKHKNDTIIVELANTSKVVLTIQDRDDLETLKQYDFQKLFQDILAKLESNDTSGLVNKDTVYRLVEKVPEDTGADEEEDWSWNSGGDDNGDDDDDDDWNVHFHSNRWGRTWQSFNLELGTNNYVSDGRFPDSDNELYSVRPWGSWYVGLSSIQRTRISKKFFLEWGVGVNWYNFKFQHDNVLIQKDDNGVTFVEDPRDVSFKKSKLTASYVTASLVPIVDFGGNSRKSRIWEGGNAFSHRLRALHWLSNCKPFENCV